MRKISRWHRLLARDSSLAARFTHRPFRASRRRRCRATAETKTSSAIDATACSAVEEALRRRIPERLRRAIFGPLGRIYPKLDWAPRFLRGKTTFQALARGTVDAYLHGVSVTAEQTRTAMYSDAFRRELQGYNARDVFHDHIRDRDFADPLALVQYLDYKTYLPGDILTKVDRASMAHSLEVRTPFLDYEFVEWAALLPSSAKLHHGVGKHVLKEALRPLLPSEVLFRKKMGFAVPLEHWFRGSLEQQIGEVVSGERLAGSGFIDPQAVKGYLADHRSGRRNYSSLLWSLLMFDGFLRAASDEVREPAVEVGRAPTVQASIQ